MRSCEAAEREGAARGRPKRWLSQRLWRAGETARGNRAGRRGEGAPFYSIKGGRLATRKSTQAIALEYWKFGDGGALVEAENEGGGWGIWTIQAPSEARANAWAVRPGEAGEIGGRSG